MNEAQAQQLVLQVGSGSVIVGSVILGLSWILGALIAITGFWLLGRSLKDEARRDRAEQKKSTDLLVEAIRDEIKEAREDQKKMIQVLTDVVRGLEKAVVVMANDIQHKKEL